MSASPIRVVFLGTPLFSVPTLKALLEDSRFEVLGVLTQPDKPSGRGQKLVPTAVKQCAEEAGLPVFQPKLLRKNQEIMDWLRGQAPDYLVTIAFGQILSQEVLDIPKKGTVNVHASLLPELRGANPIQQAVLEGKAETGITTMLTDIGVDTGDMLLTAVLPIGVNETMGELAIRMSQAGGPLLVETLQQHFVGTLQPKPQDHASATHAPKAQKTDAAIDWDVSAEEIHRKVRAFSPAPGAYCAFDGQRFKITETRLSEEMLKNSRPGQICSMIKDGILVATQDGTLLIQKLQPAGKKEMPAADWARNALKSDNGSLDFTKCFERFEEPSPVSAS